MRSKHCLNYHDFRELARRRLPGPIFNYIDGAADDETTYRRNTAAFEECDLLPNVLRGVEQVDLSVVVMEQKLQVPFYCSPTALQRLFHHQGERAETADPAVAHDLQRALAVVAGTERVGGVGEAVLMQGAGGQFTWIIPSHDLVVVRLGHYRGSREGTQALRKSLAILMEAVPKK